MSEKLKRKLAISVLFGLAVFWYFGVFSFGGKGEKQVTRERQIEMPLPPQEMEITGDAWTRVQVPRHKSLDWSVLGENTRVLTEIDPQGDGWYFFAGRTTPPFDMSQFEPSHRKVHVVTDGPTSKWGVYTKATIVLDDQPMGQLIGNVQWRKFKVARAGEKVIIRFSERAKKKSPS